MICLVCTLQEDSSKGDPLEDGWWHLESYQTVMVNQETGTGWEDLEGFCEKWSVCHTSLARCNK